MQNDHVPQQSFFIVRSRWISDPMDRCWCSSHIHGMHLSPHDVWFWTFHYALQQKIYIKISPYLKGAPNFGPALHSPPLPPVNTLQKLILYLSRRCTKLRARTPLPSPPSGGSPSSRGVVGRHSKALFGALSIFSAQPLSPNYPRCARWCLRHPPNPPNQRGTIGLALLRTTPVC